MVTKTEYKIAQKKYQILKRKINKNMRIELEKYWGTWESLKKQLFELAGADGLIEIGFVYGNGDNGNGYYKAHLMLNIKNFHEKKFTNICYLVIQYVSVADAVPEIPCTIAEFHKTKQFNFRKMFVLFEYMKQFDSSHAVFMELQRLVLRKYSTCTHAVE